MNEFEQKISRQPLRKIPGEWRGQILAACAKSNAGNRTQKPSWASILTARLSDIFWPHPKAWAALAAVWIFIFALNFSMRDNSPSIVKKYAPPSPEVIVELRKQQVLFAELMGSREMPDADRQKIFSPKPRSEYAEMLAA